MFVYGISKGIGGVSAYRKPIVAATFIAVIMVISVTCRKEPVMGFNAPTENDVLSNHIEDIVTGLGYSDEVAGDFVNMVFRWKNLQGQPVLTIWKQQLKKARQDCQQGKIPKAQLAKIEQRIANELSRRIRKEIGIELNARFYDLADIVKHRQTQCVGYSQLFYVLGISVGLRLDAINVPELAMGKLTDHVACIVGLADGGTLMVDLTRFVSKRFVIEEEFTQAGDYWELKDGDNPLEIHRKIQIIDKNGLVAVIHIKRGNAYYESSKLSSAILEYSKAIKLNPKYAEAYINRGFAFAKLGQPKKAIPDCNRAIQLNPKYASAYTCRGIVYAKLGQLTQAISDHSRSIQLNPKHAKTYVNRGMAYVGLGKLTNAISDFTKAIDLDVGSFEAYICRGTAYGKLKQHSRAISDYTRAIELKPKDAKIYYNRAVAYVSSQELGKAKEDLLNAVQLNPQLKPRIKQMSDQFKLDLKFD